MRELEIKLIGHYNLSDTVINVDGNPVKFRKNQFGHLVCNYQTEKDKVNVKIYRMLDVGGVLWFLTQIFFFLISIFGIFDIHRRERCLIPDFEAEFDLKEENKLTLQFNSPQGSGAAIKIITDLTSRVISNEYYLDVKAKKILKGLLLTKIFLALAIIATVITVLVIKLWG